MSKIHLQTPFCEINIIDEGMIGYAVATRLVQYSKKWLLSEEEDCELGSHYGVTSDTKDGRRFSCLLLSSGVGCYVNESSAVAISDTIYIASRKQICSLRLPVLDPAWHKEVDMGTCLGVYYSKEYKCLTSQGEQDVARLSLNGEIVWSVSGKDVFSEGFALYGDHIEVIDFGKKRYHINIVDGFIALVENQ